MIRLNAICIVFAIPLMAVLSNVQGAHPSIDLVARLVARRLQLGHSPRALIATLACFFCRDELRRPCRKRLRGRVEG